MGTVTLRNTAAGTGEVNKAAPLTHSELDTNFSLLMDGYNSSTTFYGAQFAVTTPIIMYGSTASGGIQFYDGNGTRCGYWYGSGGGEHGVLDNDGSWAFRMRTGTNAMEMRCNNNAEWYIYTSYCNAPGSHRAPIFYDSNSTTYYMNPNSTGESIRCAGNVVGYYSDERLKDIEGPIPDALNKVRTLEGFYYTPNKKAIELGYKPRREVGVSAQKVQAILPEVVKDAAVGHGYLTVQYEKLTPLLIEAIKDLNNRIEALDQMCSNV